LSGATDCVLTGGQTKTYEQEEEEAAGKNDHGAQAALFSLGAENLPDVNIDRIDLALGFAHAPHSVARSRLTRHHSQQCEPLAQGGDLELAYAERLGNA
jgi:hypothetical protein